MKLTLTILAAIACMSITAKADPIHYYQAAAYWYHENVSTNVPAQMDFAKFYLEDDGSGIRLVWKIEGVTPPTIAELVALSPTAHTWWKNREDTEDAGTKLNNRAMKALVKVINLRLPADKKITKAELIEAYKAETAE